MVGAERALGDSWNVPLFQLAAHFYLGPISCGMRRQATICQPLKREPDRPAALASTPHLRKIAGTLYPVFSLLSFSCCLRQFRFSLSLA